MAQPPVVGIDIGSQLMKAVELTVSPKEGLAVTALAVAPTPPGVLQNGILTDPNAMAVAVKQMLKDAGIRAKRAVGCIAGQASVVVRIIEVPRMTPAELTETMKWEVERHVPFAPTEVEMDYQPLPLQRRRHGRRRSAQYVGASRRRPARNGRLLCRRLAQSGPGACRDRYRAAGRRTRPARHRRQRPSSAARRCAGRSSRRRLRLPRKTCPLPARPAKRWLSSISARATPISASSRTAC